jgi:hypothetical protein
MVNVEGGDWLDEPLTVHAAELIAIHKATEILKTQIVNEPDAETP